MKLLKCHVENFGTLSDFELSFSDGLTVINEQNGFGKTTLATFIKAMFYGLPSTAKRDVEKDERKRTLPWQGGNFGGTLDFEQNGKVYRIERFFGAKPKDDEFALYDLSKGSKSDAFSDNIGLEIFGIDAESFERSIYMPQRDIDVQTTDSISAKLGNLVENSDDINNYDNAIAALKKRRQYYTVLNGARGAIADVKREISDLEMKIIESQTAAQNLDILRKTIKEHEDKALAIETELKQVRKSISDAAAVEVTIANKKRRDELTQEITESKEALDEISKQYPNGFMTDSEILELKTLLNELEGAKAKLEVLNQNVADKRELEALKEYFKGNVPTEEEIAAQKNNLKQLEICRFKLESAVSDNSQQKPKSKALPVVLGIGAMCIAVLGIMLLFFNVVAGVCCISVGVIAALIAGFVYFKALISSISKQGAVQPQIDYAQLTTMCEQLTEQLNTFVLRYTVGDDFAKILEEISLKLRDYQRLEQSVLKQNNDIKACSATVDELTQRVLKIFESYAAVSDNFEQNLAKIVDFKKEFARLTNVVAVCEAKIAEIPEISDEGVEVFEGLDVDNLSKREAELQKAQDELRQEITKLSAKAGQLNLIADMLSDLDAQRDGKNEQKQELEQSLLVIDKTVELLTEARENLSQRYTEPINNGFKKYSSIIEGNDVGDFMIDIELNLNVERFGKAKKKQQFSAGYKDMLDIAMRLALIDALYGEDKPVLILDDPFVNLDDERLKNALACLKKIAENQQIVYLTCHSSRAI